jgi:3-methyladenine DNA glycosylase/8-oxoguanine DNA glycosylase
VNLAPFCFDERRNCLRRKERIGQSIVTVEVRERKQGGFVMTVPNAEFSRAEVERLSQSVIRWLGLDWDPTFALEVAGRLSGPVRDLILEGGGRFLRGSTFYEDFVKTLATVNASWSFTEKMVAALVNGLGKGAFPLPGQIIKAKVSYLEKKVKMGYRAEVLFDATKLLLKNHIIDEEGRADDASVTFEDLIAIKGIGNYAATHLRVLLHDFSRIPIDSEVRPYCESRWGLNEKEIPAFFSPWGDFAFLGYKLTRIVDEENWIG